MPAHRSLSALTGHDEDARIRLDALSAIYRREGIRGVRAAAADLLVETTGDQTVDVLVEAVLTLSERAGSIGSARRDWDRFGAAEHADEQEQIERGGH